MLDCKKMTELRKQREEVSAKADAPERENELHRIHVAAMDHQLFWHSHNCN
jgi:hypothetical protein